MLKRKAAGGRRADHAGFVRFREAARAIGLDARECPEVGHWQIFDRSAGILISYWPNSRRSVMRIEKPTEKVFYHYPAEAVIASAEQLKKEAFQNAESAQS